MELAKDKQALAKTPLVSLPWDILENIFSLVEPTDLTKFACSCKTHYALAHGYLWRKPSLSLTQAMLFTRFVYRRPVVTDALPPEKDSLVQWERPLCVKTVILRLEREQEPMLDIARDAVFRRLMVFCLDAVFEIHLGSAVMAAWEQSVTRDEFSRMRIVEHPEVEKGAP